MGGNTCSICKSEAKEAVDQALVAGCSLRDIAGQYGLSKSALDRHSQDHLSATLVAATASRKLAHGEKLLDRVNGLVDKAMASVERSEAKGDERAVQGGIREARHSLELTGRITGELRESRDAAPPSALDAIIKLASALSEAQLRGMAAGDGPGGMMIEGESRVVD